MSDASNFGIGEAILQSHQGTNTKKLPSAISKISTQAELRFPTFLRECTATLHTITENELSTLGLTNLTILFPDHKPIFFNFKHSLMLTIWISTNFNEISKLN